MRKSRLAALFLALTMLLCTLPVSAAESSGWLIPKVKDSPLLHGCNGYLVRKQCGDGLSGRAHGGKVHREI